MAVLRAGLSGLLLLLSCCHRAAAGAYSPYSIAQTAFDQLLPVLAARRAQGADRGNQTDRWRIRQQQVRTALNRLFAPLPGAMPASPPRRVDRGSVDGDGFSVRKLLVETLPGYWASAALWVPPNATEGRAPAVLFPSGHSANAFREESAQLVAANLARRGFFVLGYDPVGQGERDMLQDLDGGGSVPNGSEHHSPAFEHEYMQRQLGLLGVNAASLWLRDLTRMFDLLQDIPQVDPARMGVAGCSGGGVQAAYLAAMDPRVAAASIACYMSTITVDYAPSPEGGGGPAEGEQQWGPFVGARPVLDKPDLLVARAPRPTQILLTTQDQYFPLTGGKAAIADALPAFTALGGSAALSSAVGVNKHGYVNSTRLALYDFMMRELQQTADKGTEFQPPQYFTFHQMRVTSTGSVVTAPELNGGAGSLTAHQAYVLPIAQQALTGLARARQEPSFTRDVAAQLADRIGYRSRSNVTPVKPANVTEHSAVYLLAGEGRCQVALEVLNCTGGAAREQAVLYVSRKGSTLQDPKPGQLSSAEADRVDALRADGYTVVLVDVCGFGSLGDKAGDAFGLFTLPSYDYRVHLSVPVDVAFNMNRSLVGYHAADTIQAARAVATGLLVGQPPRPVVATISANETAAAVLSAALIAQHSGASTDSLGGVAVLSSVASWADIALLARYEMSFYYSFVWGILQAFDLPDLCAALTGPVLMAAPLNAKQVQLTAAEVNSTFSFARRSNQKLTMQTNPDPWMITQQVLNWLSEVSSSLAAP